MLTHTLYLIVGNENVAQDVGNAKDRECNSTTLRLSLPPAGSTARP